MLVKMKNNKAAVSYRGVAFVGSEPVEVTEEWMAACKSPRIVEVKAKKTKKAPETVELMDFKEE